MSENTCADCAAFSKLQDQSGPGVIEFGKCRRRSPQVVVHRYITNQVVAEGGAIVQVLNGLIDGYFPPTNSSLSCCDFLPKEEPSVVIDLGEEPLPIAGLVDPAITH